MTAQDKEASLAGIGAQFAKNLSNFPASVASGYSGLGGKLMLGLGAGALVASPQDKGSIIGGELGAAAVMGLTHKLPLWLSLPASFGGYSLASRAGSVFDSKAPKLGADALRPSMKVGGAGVTAYPPEE